MLLSNKPLIGSQIRQFRDALKMVFKLEELRLLVADHLDESLEDIVLLRDIDYPTVVQKVIEATERTSRTAELLQGALIERPQDVQYPAPQNPPEPPAKSYVTLKLSLDTNAIIKLNKNRTRVLYRTTTGKGSSGAPCFTADWKLIALNHAGDPMYDKAIRPPEYNQGIPFHAIVNLLKKRGIWEILTERNSAVEDDDMTMKEERGKTLQDPEIDEKKTL